MLHFDRVLVTETEFKINEKVPFSEWLDKDNQLTIEPAVQKGTKEDNKGRALINFIVGDKDDRTSPFFIKATVVGYFTCDENEDILDKYGLNMVNILLPYGRTYIGSLTGLAGYQSVIIQPINVIDLLEKSKEENVETETKENK